MGLLDGLLAAIEKDPQMGPRFTELRELDNEIDRVLKFVDLEIACSPVLLSGDDFQRDSSKIYEGSNGTFVVMDGTDKGRVLTRDEATRARARYLVCTKREQAKRLAPIFRKKG
jgi:hypothetical protein